MKRIQSLVGQFDLNDILFITGVGLVGFGLWKIYPPVAFIAGGIGLIWFGLAGAKNGRKS